MTRGERRADYMKAWRAANPRDRRAYKAAYDAAHRVEQSAYREATRERHQRQNAAWYAANRERILARVKAHFEANRDRVLAYHAAYYEANTERIKATVTAYNAAHPEERAHLENRRRARKAANGGSHTLAQRREKFAEYGNACCYCGRAGRLTVDHLIPLCRGGTDAIENIAPACRSCNSRKNAKTVEEFHQRVGGIGR